MQGKRFQHIPETFPLHGLKSIFKPSGIYLSIVRFAMHGSFSYLSCSGTGRFIVLGAVSLIIALCISAAPSGAHSPAAMSLAYNDTAGELAVTITHQVIDPATHYVREVQVRADGQTVKTIPYPSQPTPTTFTYIYPLQVQAGTSVTVDASCILGGSITRTLFVPGSAGSAPAVPQSTGSTPVVSGSTISTPVVQGSAGSSPVVPDLQVPTTKAAAGLIPILGLVLMLIWRRSG
jgi:hypothetical protein